MSLITPVILVGGSGKRLWPLSRESGHRRLPEPPTRMTGVMSDIWRAI